MRERRNAYYRDYFQKPEQKARRAANYQDWKARPGNDGYRKEYNRRRRQQPRVKELERQHELRRRAKPEHREKRRAYSRIYNRSPERQESRRQYQRERYQRPEIWQRIRIYMKRWRTERRVFEFFWQLDRFDTLAQSRQEGEKVNVCAEVQAHLDKLQKKTDAELEDLIRDGLRFVQERLLILAGAVALLERRGVEPPGPKYLLRLLRQIAEGKLLAEAVVRFGGRGHTFDALRALPAEQQREVLSLDDDAVEAKFLQPVRRQSLSGSKKRRTVIDSDTLAGMAAAGTPKDVVEMCLTLVEYSDNPQLVADLLAKELDGVRRKKLKPSLVG